MYAFLYTRTLYYYAYYSRIVLALCPGIGRVALHHRVVDFCVLFMAAAGN